MLDRAEEITVGGNRPSAYGKVKIGGTKDGTLTAYEVDATARPASAAAPRSTWACCPTSTRSRTSSASTRVVRLNAGRQRAMRAPGHPQNCVLTDCAARRPGGQARHRSAAGPAQEPAAQRSGGGQERPAVARRHCATRSTRKEIEIAAELSEWKEKWHPPGQGPDKGRSSTASAWPCTPGAAQASPQPNECTVIIGQRRLGDGADLDPGPGHRRSAR